MCVNLKNRPVGNVASLVPRITNYYIRIVARARTWSMLCIKRETDYRDVFEPQNGSDGKKSKLRKKDEEKCPTGYWL